MTLDPRPSTLDPRPSIIRIARPRADFVGIGLLAVGIGSLQTMIERGNREDWFDSSFIRWLALFAAVGLVLFVLRELRTPEPAVNLRVLQHRGLAAGVLFSLVLGFGLYGSVYILPVFLQQARHYTAAQSGWILLPGGIAMALAMALAGQVVTRLVPRNMVAAGALAMSGAMFLLSTMTLDTGPEHLFWPLVLRGAAFAVLWVPLSLASLDGLEGPDLAAGSGLFNLTRQLGGSAGIAVLSTLLDHRTAAHRAVLVEHVTVYDPATAERLHTLTAGLMAHGSLPVVAREQALALLDRTVQGQAAILAFEDLFWVIGLAFLCALPLLLLFKNRKPASAYRLGLVE